MRISVGSLMLACVPGAPVGAFGQACVPHWSGQWTTGDTPTVPYAFAVYDDGTGPKLHAGGGGPPWVGRWDGNGWTYAAVEPRHFQDGYYYVKGVRALKGFSDGIGPHPALYAAGYFTQIGGVAAASIARWDGQSWSGLAEGIPGGWIDDLEVFDDGGGSQLYVGGRFAAAGGIAACGIARWDGRDWGSLGPGIAGTPNQEWVNDLAVHDDGSGPALYIVGLFSSVSGVAAHNIARWSIAGWSPVGAGFAEGGLVALASVPEAGGTGLYVGGNALSGPLAVAPLQRWDGAAWSPVAGAEGWPSVSHLAVLDAGEGAQLHAAIMFSDKFSTWGALSHRDGQQWTLYPDGVATRAITSHDLGSGPRLVQSGFTSVSPPHGSGWGSEEFRVFDNEQWARFGPEGFQGAVLVLEVIDIGGPALYAGGHHWSGGSVRRWSGTSWDQVGTGTPLTVQAIARYNDGTGPALYAGGHSVIYDKLYTACEETGALSRWTGAAWDRVPGLSDCTLVNALQVFSDGALVGLYVAGEFTQAGGLNTGSIARWRQGQWSALGTGITGKVHDLLVHDDGAGSSLFACGEFGAAGGVPARSIARWDGQAWHALGSGLYFNPAQTQAPAAYTMARHDDGSGPRLYVSGSFDRAGGVVAKHIARWDGQAWSPVGLGLTGPASALRGFNDGTGPALYATGSFGASTLNFRKWTGTTWLGVGGGTSVPASTMAAFNDGSGPALWLGGSFVAAGNRSSGRIAKWIGCPACYPDCTGDGALTVADFGCFQTKFASGSDYADCTGDGLWTVSDFGCFQTRFVTGCP